MEILVNSMKPTDIWKSAGRAGPVQMFRIHTRQRWDIDKGVEIRLAQAHSSMTRLAILWKISAISLSHEDSTLQITFLVDTALWMWKLYVDGGSEEANDFRLLKTDATEGYLAYDAESIKWPNMYGNRSISLPDISSCYDNCQALQVIMVWPCLSSWYTAEDHVTRNSGW